MTEDQRFWLGLGVAAVFVVLGAAMQAAFQLGSGRKIFFRATIFAMFLLGAVVALWAVTQRYLPGPANRVSPADALAAQLSNKEWALDGESCERDGIRFTAQESELVAHPKRSGTMHYRLLSANGQRLVTEYHDRLVIFEIRSDGFTYIDRGSEGWYRLCG
jgi:hypothetical protein